MDNANTAPTFHELCVIQLEVKIFLLLMPESVEYYFTQTKRVLSQVRLVISENISQKQCL